MEVTVIVSVSPEKMRTAFGGSRRGTAPGLPAVPPTFGGRLKRIPNCGSCVVSGRFEVRESSQTDAESMPHMRTIFPSPLCSDGTERLSRLFAVSVSANVPPAVDAFEAVLRTTARGIV